jgi:hypothetical protein
MILDVYVTLRLGDGSIWAQSTDIAKNGGLEDTEWKFEGEDMSGEVDAAILHRNVINFTVKDSTEVSVDKYVGKAQVSMEDLLDDTNTNKLVTLSGELHGHDDAEPAGEYTIKIKFLVPNARSGSIDARDGVVSDMVEEKEPNKEFEEE